MHSAPEEVKTDKQKLTELYEKYRDVLSLYYLNELTVAEISRLLSRKESTVK